MNYTTVRSDTAAVIRNTAALVRNTAALVRNTAALVRNTAALVRNTAALIRNSAAVICNTAALVRNSAAAGGTLATAPRHYRTNASIEQRLIDAQITLDPVLSGAARRLGMNIGQAFTAKDAKIFEFTAYSSPLRSSRDCSG